MQRHERHDHERHDPEPDKPDPKDTRAKWLLLAIAVLLGMIAARRLNRLFLYPRLARVGGLWCHGPS